MFASSLNRPSLLRSAASVTAATTLPAWFFEETSIAAARHGNLVAYCDLDAARLAEAKKLWPEAAQLQVFRQRLERKYIDVIVNGTPDHRHTPVNISAPIAGKDIYSEKPLTLMINEGRRLVDLVKRTKRILQTGSQQRSDKNFRLA